MTTQQPTNWIKHPKVSHLILFIAAWLIGVGLLLFVITDSFTQYEFSKRHIILYLLIFGSTWTTCEVALNYFRNRK